MLKMKEASKDASFFISKRINSLNIFIELIRIMCYDTINEFDNY